MNKTTVFAVAALATTLLASPLAHAQAPAAATRHRGAGMQKMAAALGLTDAQKAQMKTIAQNARAQMKAFQTGGTPPSADTQAKIKAIRKTTREQMLAVLTPAQKQQLKQMRQQSKGQ